VAGLLRLPADTPLLQVRALHLADGAPFCLEDRWINPAAAPGVEGVDLTTISANEWLVRHTAFSGGDIDFGAVAADAGTAALLACAEGAALFEIGRTTWAGAQPITAVRLTYAPGYRMRTAI
jgi:GntR family histidine utilization transcriptional repressor